MDYNSKTLTLLFGVLRLCLAKLRGVFRNNTSAKANLYRRQDILAYISLPVYAFPCCFLFCFAFDYPKMKKKSTGVKGGGGGDQLAVYIA